MGKITEPGIRVDASGLHVISEEVAQKLEKKKLSPSLVSGLNKCPASWLGESFVIRDIIEEEPDNAARRGSLFHKVMEEFFLEEPEARTTTRMKAIVEEVLSTEEFQDMKAMPEAIQWLRDAINRYYEMGAKPQKVQVAKIPNRKGELVPGLEVFVDGKVGNTKRPILGFIDRLVVDQRRDDGSIVIEDWKTGAKAKRWNPKTKSTDGLGEARQQIIYSMLLQDRGEKVSGARLIFPVAKEIVTVDLQDQDLRQRVIRDVEEADAKLSVMEDNNTFEYNPNFLCAWCPLAKMCPRAMVKPYEKMQAAYAKQPSLDVLSKGFEIA